MLSFFGNGSIPSEESDFVDDGPAETKKKRKLLSIANIMYGSYLKYGFISTGDSEAPYPLCPICNSKLSNKVIRPSKLLRHMKTKHAELEDKSLEFFERRKRDREVEKRLLRTVVSTNLNALRQRFLTSG